MNRKRLGESLGRKVRIKLFDGETIEGRLRKTGEEGYERDPILCLSRNMYFLTDGISKECRTRLFRASHVRSLKALGEDGRA